MEKIKYEHSEMEKTNKLLALLIDIIMATHNYEPMGDFRGQLKEIMK